MELSVFLFQSCSSQNRSFSVFDRCLGLAIGDLYATPLDFWRPGVAGPKFNVTSAPGSGGGHRVEAVVVEFESNVTFTFGHADMKRFHQQVETWFR